MELGKKCKRNILSPGKVSHNPGWPQTHNVAKYNFELLNSTSLGLELELCTTVPGFSKY